MFLYYFFSLPPIDSLVFPLLSLLYHWIFPFLKRLVFVYIRSWQSVESVTSSVLNARRELVGLVGSITEYWESRDAWLERMFEGLE